jgi:hypothetical protein
MRGFPAAKFACLMRSFALLNGSESLVDPEF